MGGGVVEIVFSFLDYRKGLQVAEGVLQGVLEELSRLGWHVCRAKVLSYEISYEK